MLDWEIKNPRTKAIHLNREERQSVRIPIPQAPPFFFAINVDHFFYRTRNFKDYKVIWPSHIPCSLGGERPMKYTLRPSELYSEHG